MLISSLAVIIDSFLFVFYSAYMTPIPYQTFKSYTPLKLENRSFRLDEGLVRGAWQNPPSAYLHSAAHQSPCRREDPRAPPTASTGEELSSYDQEQLVSPYLTLHQLIIIIHQHVHLCRPSIGLPSH